MALREATASFFPTSFQLGLTHAHYLEQCGVSLLQIEIFYQLSARVYHQGVQL